MKRFVILVLMLQMTVYLAFAQNAHPVSWKFSAEKIGDLTYRVKLHAIVAEPYHIYPQGAGGSMGMPTEISFVEDDNVVFIGEMAERGDEQQGDQSLSYYSKGVTFSRQLKLKSEQNTTLAFTIKYMACTNEMCLPPSKKQFTLALQDGKAADAVSPNAASSVNAVVKSGNAYTYEDFTMADTEGKMIFSKDITSKSEYTFIDFWASWCAPCRKQGRELIPLYNNYKAKGLNVIAVSLDTDAKAWKKAIEADGYTWANLSDLKGFESAISKRYNITAIPRNLLIDQKGNIVAMDLHGKELEEKLKALLEI